ncbi:MAG TPA: hypothetical protein ENN43_05745 [bacterium]|mgnify:CR=1 FL=1|nr:hypothetical protein [bacterium]
MKRYLKEHEEFVKRRLLESAEEYDWAALKEHHLKRISFMQHERLIHLLVTLAFGVFLFLSVAAVYCGGAVEMAAAVILILLLLIPYIHHYYRLENAVQRWYKLADEIDRKINGAL